MPTKRIMTYGTQVFCPGCKSGNVSFGVMGKGFICRDCKCIFAIADPGFESKEGKPSESKASKKVVGPKRKSYANGKSPKA